MTDRSKNVEEVLAPGTQVSAGGVSAGFGAAVTSALAPGSENRPRDVSAWRAQWDAGTASAPAQAPARPVPPPPRDEWAALPAAVKAAEGVRRRGGPWLVSALAAPVLAAAVAVGFVTGESHTGPETTGGVTGGSGSAGGGVVTAGEEQGLEGPETMAVMLRAEGVTASGDRFMAREAFDSLLTGRVLTVHLEHESFTFEFREDGRVFATPFGFEIPSGRIEPVRLAEFSVREGAAVATTQYRDSDGTVSELRIDVATTRVLVFQYVNLVARRCQCEEGSPVWTIDLTFNSESSGSVAARFINQWGEGDPAGGVFRVD